MASERRCGPGRIELDAASTETAGSAGSGERCRCGCAGGDASAGCAVAERIYGVEWQRWRWAGGAARALFTDGRYTEQAKAEVAGLRVVIGKGAPGAQAAAWLAERKGWSKNARCGFDAVQTTVAALDAMRKALPAGQRRSFLWRPQGRGGAAARGEGRGRDCARCGGAAALGCRLFEGVLTNLSAGETESEIAVVMELEARRAGAEGMSFETIVASGERSALPHGRASAAKLPRRGFVTLDFGVVLDGYCSDMTRTVHLGKATTREWDVYHSVLEAQQAGVSAVAPGATCGEVDEAARSVLRKAKLER